MICVRWEWVIRLFGQIWFFSLCPRVWLVVKILESHCNLNQNKCGYDFDLLQTWNRSLMKKCKLCSSLFNTVFVLNEPLTSWRIRLKEIVILWLQLKISLIKQEGFFNGATEHKSFCSPDNNLTNAYIWYQKVGRMSPSLLFTNIFKNVLNHCKNILSKFSHHFTSRELKAI